MSAKIEEAKKLVKLNTSVARFLRLMAYRLEREAIHAKRDINKYKTDDKRYLYRSRDWIELAGCRLTYIYGKAFFHNAGSRLELARDVNIYSDSDIFKRTDYFEKDSLAKLKLKYKLTEFQYYTSKHYRGLVPFWNGFGHVIHDAVDVSGELDCFDDPARVITIRPMGDFEKGVEFKLPAYALMLLRNKQEPNFHEIAIEIKKRKKIKNEYT